MVIARYVRADPELRSLFIFRVFNSGTPLVGGVVFVGHQFLKSIFSESFAARLAAQDTRRGTRAVRRATFPAGALLSWLGAVHCADVCLKLNMFACPANSAE